MRAETLAFVARPQMSRPEFYVNAPASAAGARYDAVVTPEAVVDAVLAQPDAAARAAAFGGDTRAQLLDAAAYAIRLARPAAMRALDAFARGEKFFSRRLLSAGATSDKAIRAAFGVVVQIVVWALRLTSPVTTRALGYALKAAIPAVLAAAGVEAALLPFGLSDPHAKHNVVRVDDAELARIRAGLRDMPFYRFFYDEGAADPDDGIPHLGMMADELRRRFGIGDGHTVPLFDLITVLAVAQRETDRELGELRGTVGAMRAQLDRLAAAPGYAGSPDGAAGAVDARGLAARLAAAFPRVRAADWARGAADMLGGARADVGVFGGARRCVLVEAPHARWAVVGAGADVRVFRVAAGARLVARFDGAWAAALARSADDGA